MLYGIGTIVSIVRFVTAPNGMHHLIGQGEERFRVAGFLAGLPYLAARFDTISENEGADAEVQARVKALKEQTVAITRLLPEVPLEFAATLASVEPPEPWRIWWRVFSTSSPTRNSASSRPWTSASVSTGCWRAPASNSRC
jgi:Lon protease-like protein